MRIVVRIAIDEHGYRAWCPSLPGCVAHGETAEEARRNIEDAIVGYLASLNVTTPAEVTEQTVAA